jgi:hypothetical protein
MKAALYLAALLSTEEGSEKLSETHRFPSHPHGWFGFFRSFLMLYTASPRCQENTHRFSKNKLLPFSGGILHLPERLMCDE